MEFIQKQIEIGCDSGAVITLPRNVAQLSPILKSLEGDEQFPLLYGEDVFHWVKAFLEQYIVEPMSSIPLPVKYSTPLDTLVSTWYVEFLKDVPVSKVKMLFDVACLLDIEPLVDLLAIHIGRLYALLSKEDVRLHFGIEFNFEEQDVKIARGALTHHEQFVKV